MAACDIGVEAFNLVGEANILKEIERAIDRGRLGRAFPVQIAEQVIGFCRFRRFQQKAQNLAANAGQLLAALLGQGFCLCQSGLNFLRRARTVSVDMRVCILMSHGAYLGAFGGFVKPQPVLLPIPQGKSCAIIR